MSDTPTDPRGLLPTRRHHTGSAEELADTLRNAVEHAVGPAVATAMRPIAEEVMANSVQVERLELRAKRTDVRLVVIEATRIIIPSALAAGALLLSGINTALIIWMHSHP